MYKIVGTDNREYGPVSQEEVRAWIAQGRANAATIARLEGEPWKPLGTFDEFKEAFAGAAPPPAASSQFFTARAGSETNGMAVAGLVFSILGLCCCCCCPMAVSVLGLILSLIGLNQINAQPGRYSTSPALAKVGIGLGIAGIILGLIGIIWNAVTGGFTTFLQGIKAGASAAH